MKNLKIVFIRPSKYDDDGYVLRYWRGILPSNTLTCLESLTKSLAAKKVLGSDVEVSVGLHDDTVEPIPYKRIVRESRRKDTTLLVGITGVQSNQFPRATDIALKLRKSGVQVIVGGFHVSGTMELFDGIRPELQKLLDNGVSLFRGEAEAPDILEQVLRDALSLSLRPIYEAAPFPDISQAPVPEPSIGSLDKFFIKGMATIDTCRGCPFGCTFCTVINVQGRKMRQRSAECVLEGIERNWQRGIRTYMFTDDNFARNPEWEKILDGMIEMRLRGVEILFMMQVDTQAHRIRGFVHKAKRAGCYLIFVGVETVDAKNIEILGKKQNRAEDYAAMAATWRDAKVLVHASYMVGLPNDTSESVSKAVDVLRNQIKADQVTFFMLTPLPGSQDHLRMVREGVPLDADLNNYDSMHETFRQANLAPGEWQAAYDDAYRTFYGKENIINTLFRTRKKDYWRMFGTFIWYRYCALEGIHPMLTGLVRKKERKERRSIFPRENVFKYAWRRIKDLSWMAKTYASLIFEFQEIWLLTRKTDDPRFATLSQLRSRWTDAQLKLKEFDIRGRRDLAYKEVTEMLGTASEEIGRLSEYPKAVGFRARKKLRRMACDIEAYRKNFELQMPGWRRVVDAEKYISENLLVHYEDLAIKYVAKRRRFSAYRREVIDRLKSGRILTMNVSLIPRIVVFETFLALRFGITFLTHS